jgi:3-oxoadipate enol-lactonase
MPMTELRGTTIHHQQAGTGPDLLFIHGMCGDAEVWADQVLRLQDRFTCTTYDRRGHSRSPRGDAPERDATHAEDAAALVEALGLDLVTVVASSGGARIGLELLRQRPDLVRGAVLSEPPLLGVVPDHAERFVAELSPKVTSAVRDQGPEAAVDAFFDHVCPGLWSQLDEGRRARYRANAPAMLAELASTPSTITGADLGQLTTPVLLLSGTASHPAFRAVVDVLARTLPDARLVELEGCGHVTYAEQPERFAEAVATFAHEILVSRA